MRASKDKNKKNFVTNRSLIDTFNNALSGILNAVRSERNMKIHLVMSILVILSTLFLDFSKMELAILSIVIVLVFITEFINTAIEEVVDLLTKGRYSKVAKRVKDISAGAVFLAAISSLLIAYLIMYDKVKKLLLGGDLSISRVLQKPEHMTFLAVSLVLISVILIKGIFYKRKTTHFQGGTVSGHSALAFTLATIAAILAKNFEVSLITFIIAGLVAEARVEAKIHTIREVILGAILGIAVSLLLFQGYY